MSISFIQRKQRGAILDAWQHTFFGRWTVRSLLCLLVNFSLVADEGKKELLAVSSAASGYAICAGCHGPSGEGGEAMRAPRLAGQDPAYLRAQVKAFREGTRKPDVHFPQAAAMQQTVAKLEENEIEQILSQIAEFPIMDPPQRLDGNHARGLDLYTRGCAICHGERGSGDFGMHLPRLNHQHGWYLKRQLDRFRAGERGSAEDHADARAMQFYATLLPDEEAVTDVVAYLGKARLFGSPEYPKGNGEKEENRVQQK